MGEISGLNWLRGAAALLVLVSHSRKMFFVSYEEYQGAKGILVKLFYLVTNLGTPAVMTFFVLSGYLVAGSASRSVVRKNWSWKSYLINRTSRLWTVLIPCLFLTLACDKIGWLLFSPSFYDGSLAGLIDSAPEGRISHSALEFLGNSLFLNGILVSSYGSNGPLWSISYEFWYYILFPLLLTLPLIRHRILLMGFQFGTTVLVAICVGPAILMLFPIWLMGYLAWLMRESSFSRLLGANTCFSIGACIALGFGFTAVRANASLDGIVGKYLLGMLTAIAIPALHHGIFNKGSRISSALSRISYSLYLSHFPILVLFATATGIKRSPSIMGGWAMFFASIALSLLTAITIYNLFERRTPTIRRALYAATNMFSRPSAV